ncbi:transposase [Patescibacteria group bacterium]|nr:transposase [Patescibacteria group bacterium]
MGVICEKKWCKKCGKKLQKWGKNKNGSQRYFCKKCKQTNTRKRPEISQINHNKIFINWLLGKDSKDEVASDYGVSRRTLVNWFSSFWDDEPVSKQTDISNKVVIADGKYIAKDGCVLVSVCDEKTASWHFSQRENFSSWLAFLNSLKQIPFAIVCDGQKGMFKAIKQRFPGTIIQRCQFHVIKYIRSKLTKNPESIAAIELKKLVLEITKIKTREQLKDWLTNYKYWWQVNKDFVKEKTYTINSFTPTGRQRWHYTHRNLHASHSHLKNALPCLFRYIQHPEIPNTSNFVEGGINALMQEKLRLHRGLKLPKRRVLIAHFLSSKQ